MRNKTYKLKKLEKNRFSILTNDMEHCYICKSPFVEIHEIYGGRNRKISMLNGFCVPLCHRHHEYVTLNADGSNYLKQKCQSVFEETHNRKDFIEIIGRSYLWT